ncbi:MAG: DMT family transporter [Thermoprotei archaeon]
MLGSVLAIAIALVWGFSTVLIRKNLTESNYFSVSLIITIVGLMVFAPLVFLFISLNSVNVYGLLFFFLAGIFHPGFVRLLYFKGMEKVGASVNAAIYASNPIFSSLIAVILLNEKLELIGWIGILCVVLGAILIENINSDHPQPSIRKGLVYSFSAALLVGFSYVARKEGLILWDSPIIGATISYIAALLVYSCAFPFLSNNVNNRTLNRLAFKLFWKAGVGISIGQLLSFYALKYSDVSTVVPLIQIEPLFIFLFIRYYLKGIEIISHKLVLGTLIIILGVFLVMLS